MIRITVVLKLQRLCNLQKWPEFWVFMQDGRISYDEFAAMMKAGTDWRKASRQYSRERFNSLSLNLMRDGSLQLKQWEGRWFLHKQNRPSCSRTVIHSNEKLQICGFHNSLFLSIFFSLLFSPSLFFFFPFVWKVG